MIKSGLKKHLELGLAKTNMRFEILFDCQKLVGQLPTMTIQVVEFSRKGYKIRQVFAKNQLLPNEIIEYCELV